MSRLYVRKGEVASNFAVSTWQSVMFSEFEAQMSSLSRPFPCCVRRRWATDRDQLRLSVSGFHLTPTSWASSLRSS